MKDKTPMTRSKIAIIYDPVRTLKQKQQFAIFIKFKTGFRLNSVKCHDPKQANNTITKKILFITTSQELDSSYFLLLHLQTLDKKSISENFIRKIRIRLLSLLSHFDLETVLEKMLNSTFRLLPRKVRSLTASSGTIGLKYF